MEEACGRIKCVGRREKGRCTLQIKLECRRKYDCCCVELNLATVTYWGYYLILSIGVSLIQVIILVHLLYIKQRRERNAC